MFGAVAVTTLQQVAPRHAHGRVLGISATLQSWVESIAVPVGGLVVAALGVRPGALALAGVTVTAGLTGLAIAIATRSDHPWTQASEGASSAE